MILKSKNFQFPNRKNWMRSRRGAVLLEGAIGTSLVILALVMTGLALINVGLLAYYKNRLVFVTQESANFAADTVTHTGTYWNHVMANANVAHHWKPDTTAFAKRLLVAAGLPQAERITVSYQYPAGLHEPMSASVTISLRSLPVVGNLPFFNQISTLKDTSVALVRNDQPPGTLTHYQSALVGATLSGPFHPAYGVVTGPNAGPNNAGAGYAILRPFQHPHKVYTVVIPSDHNPANSFWAHMPQGSVPF